MPSAAIGTRGSWTAFALVALQAWVGAQGHPFGVPSSPGGGVHAFHVSADGEWVAYSAEGARGSALELHALRLPVSSAPVHLGVSLLPSAPWVVASEAQRVVYLDRDLWSVPIDGSASPVRLSDFTSQGAVRDFAVAEDGAHVLFRSAPAERSFGLFVVPADGSAHPVPLVVPGIAGEVDAGYRTTDTGEVVFTSRHHDGLHTRLYSGPLDGSVASVAVRSIAGANVRDFVISPDGLRVVYRSSWGMQEASELRVAPIGLGGTLETERRLVGGTAIEDFAISPDGALVVYTSPQSGGARRTLHRIPIDGSAEPLQLAGDLDSGFVLEPQARFALFRADRAGDERFALRVVRLDGSRPSSRLSGPLTEEGHVGWFGLTLNGVLYQAYRGGDPTDFPADLWHVSRSSLPVELAGVDDACGFRIGDDSRCLVYQDEGRTLWGYSVGTQPVALASNTVADAFHIDTSSERVLYLARGTGTDAGLYSVRVDDGSARVRLDRPDLCEHGPLPPPGSEALGGDVGFRDFSFGDTGSSTPTGEKPESKLWFNDGSWWGSLYNDADTAYHIYRLDFATQIWEDTGTRLDQRNSTKADVLWDDASQKLYVASHIFTLNAQPTATNWGNLRRYSYDPSTDTYDPDTGFPVDITRGNAEALTIARDSTGRVWATWVESGKVMINHSVASDTDWGLPFVLPVDDTAVTATTEDVSAIVAFGGNKVGIMWSNQTTMNTFFAVHADGDAAGDWAEPEVVVPGGNCASSCSDDHFNLKSDGDGRVFAALKTSQTGLDDALNLVAVRDSGGWTNAVVGKVADHHTRPILLFDEENEVLHFFATTPENGGAIFHKSAPLATLDFGAGKGDPFIQNALDLVVNNATSTKQNVDSTTDLVVLASDRDNTFYLHNFIDIQAAMHAPVITGFDPGSGVVGTAVEIHGTDFTDVQSVRFNGTAAAFDVISETRIDTHVPPAASTGKITVETLAGTAESSSDFVIEDVPTITLFKPGTGPVGTVVVLRGTNFTGATSVRFNGTEADFTVVSDMRIDTVVPPGATTGKITVTTPSGTAESNAAFGVGNCPAEPTISLWPPNHKYVTLDLEDILDMDDIEILSITQDEPVSFGINHTCDGYGVGTSVANIRAERLGPFNGRVYSINYSAMGGECAGFLTVVVPHDQSGRPAIDDGQLYASGEDCN